MEEQKTVDVNSNKVENKTNTTTQKLETTIVEVKQPAKPYGRVNKSKIVYIRHKPDNNVYLPFRMKDEAIKNKIGASLHGQDVKRGLNSDEERRFLPNIIGVSPDSENWDKAVRSYWDNISKLVPPSDGEGGGGLKLEIGRVYTKLEDEEFDSICSDESLKKGFPINVPDFVLWRYCLVYNRVANSIDDIHKSPKIDFYIFSSEEDIITKKSSLKLERDANMLSYQRMADRDWVDSILRLFVSNDKQSKIAIRELEKMTEDEKDIALAHYVKTQPEKFLLLGNDANLQLKGFIEFCIVRGILLRLPNTDTILMGDLTLGSSIDEAVVFLKNPKNSKTYETLKAQNAVAP